MTQILYELNFLKISLLSTQKLQVTNYNHLLAHLSRAFERTKNPGTDTKVPPPTTSVVSSFLTYELQIWQSGNT